jgi:hypothetical protein
MSLVDDLGVTMQTLDVEIVVEDVSQVGVGTDPDVVYIMAANVGPQGPPGVSGLPTDTVIPAATRIISNKFLAADVMPAWRVMGDGRFDWGAGGSSAFDTSLYRSAVNMLKTDGGFEIVGMASGTGIKVSGTPNPVLGSNANASQRIIFNKLLAADANEAYTIFGNGTQRWGAGGVSTYDVDLFRSAANQLKTSWSFLAGQDVYAQHGAATQVRIGNSSGNASLAFGSALDAILYRGGAGLLRTDTAFTAGTTVRAAYNSNGGDGFYYNPSSSSVMTNALAFASFKQGDANSMLIIRGDGKHEWGPGGASATDTSLSRYTPGGLAINAVGTTSGRLRVYSAAATPFNAFETLYTGDAQLRFYIVSNGSIYWGDGASSADIVLSRQAAGLLGLGVSTMPVRLRMFTAASGNALEIFNTTDSAAKFYMETSGKLNWGVGGSSATDVNLYRGAADLLKTDDAFYAVKDIVANYGDANYQIWLTPNAGIRFGAPWDTAVFRQQAGVVGVTGILAVSSAIYANQNLSSQIILNTDGHIYFGTAGDTHFYRSAAGILATDGGFRTNLASGRSFGHYGAIADTAPKFQIAASDGALSWGVGGTTATDTNLYRVAASSLETNGRMFWRIAGVGSEAINLIVQGETQERFKLYNDGKHRWGPGGGSGVDTVLYRAAVGTLEIDASLIVGDGVATMTYGVFVRPPAVGTICFSTMPGNNGPNNYFQVNGQGTLQWGLGGANAVDTNLYRSGVNTLKTDGNLIVGGSITVLGGGISGAEMAYFSDSTNYGPTQVSGGGNGDALFTLPAFTADGTSRYYIEFSCYTEDAGGLAQMEFRLHDGAAPGPLIKALIYRTPGSNPGNPVTYRIPWVPTAGSHTVHVRWRDITTGRTYTMPNSGYPVTCRVVKA